MILRFFHRRKSTENVKKTKKTNSQFNMRNTESNGLFFLETYRLKGLELAVVDRYIKDSSTL